MKWKVKYEYNDNFFDLIKQDKQLSQEELDSFIDVTKSKFRNPNILPNIEKAIQRTKQAINNNEKIMIAGDYDCDGVTSTAIMVMGLKLLTPNVDWIIPKRQDGYGLSKKIIDEAIEKNINLIITVDNGIAAHDAIKYANENNIDVIVTDHHQHLTEELPTEIVVDPYIDHTYPFHSICGCMVSYKFLRLLIPDLHTRIIHKEIVVLTMIATIADAMELKDENRKFVFNGLKIINSNDKLSFGVQALIDGLNMKRGSITSTDIAFYIAPCVNAVGRINDAEMAVRLFLADDETEAIKLAQEAISLNNHRKYIQKKIIDKTEVNENDYFLIQIIDEVPEGILGILAGNFASKYQKPCFVLHNHEGVLSGSGRTFSDFDISSCVSESFDICSGGGHKAACGVRVSEKNLNEFKNRCIKKYKKWASTKQDVSPTIEFLCDIDFGYINNSLLDNIALLSPYGNGNLEPQFCTYQVKVKDYKILGKTKNTIKFKLEQNGYIFDAICFNDIKDLYFKLGEPKIMDVGYTLSYNVWAGKKTIQLMIVDMKI